MLPRLPALVLLWGWLGLSPDSLHWVKGEEPCALMHTGPRRKHTREKLTLLVAFPFIDSMQETLQVLWEHTPAAKNRQ